MVHNQRAYRAMPVLEGTVREHEHWLRRLVVDDDRTCRQNMLTQKLEALLALLVEQVAVPVSFLRSRE